MRIALHDFKNSCYNLFNLPSESFSNKSFARPYFRELVEMKSHSIKILLIVENEDDYLRFRDMLSDVHCSEFELKWVSDVKVGLDQIQRGGCDICLVDYCLAGWTGFDFLRSAINTACRVPVIFLTDREDRDLDLEAMRAGAADCLAKKKLSPLLLERSFYYALEYKKRNDELLRAKRVIQSLSACSDAVIRIKEELELLGEICRIVVNVGGYRMAWVGYAEHDEARSVVPVGKYGYEEGYLRTANITWRDEERGRGPVGTAIRTGAPSIIRVVQNDPNFEPWRQEAILRGYASACGLPLLLEGKVLGALTIYSSEPDAFGAEELELLVKLSGNLSYGIEALRARKAQFKAEESLKAAYTDLERRVGERTAELSDVNKALKREIAERIRMQEELEVSALRSEAQYQCNPIPTFTWQKTAEDFVLLGFNKAAEAMTEGTVAEAIGKMASDMYVHRQDILRDLHLCAAQRVIVRRETTSWYLVQDRSILLTFAFVPPDLVMAHVEDVTERKRSEDALQAAHEKFKGIIEFLPDATFVVDRAGKVIAWNRAIEEMTGVPKEEMIGMGYYAYAVPFYGEPRPILIDLVMKNINGQTDLYDYIERQDKLLSGEVFVPQTYKGKGAYLWGTASPLFDMNGNLSGAVEAIRDVTEQKQIESVLLKREGELEEKAHQLEEINIALKVLLKRREEDKKELEESLLTNVKESVLPFLEKLKKSGLDENQKTYLGIVESQLGEIISPFLRSLSSKFTNLTPMEVKVAKLIKEGRTSKEIAEILGVAEQTIMTHRNNLRAKLGLRNEKVNLYSHLMSLK